MSPSQDQIKAWWFDRLSDLAAQNMTLMAEVAALREQLAPRGSVNHPQSNGKGVEPPTARGEL